MRDIRLEEMPFEFEGKTYLLRCNMNVLADVQDSFGGSITAAMTGGKTYRSVLEFLAAMMNDYADEMGWPERYTARTLGRRLSAVTVPVTEIMHLAVRAMIPPEAEDAGETGAEVSGTDTGETEPDQSGN